MKRVFMAAVCCAAFFALSHGRAQALTEFCPAGVAVEPVGASGDRDAPASLYGFELTAEGARTASGTIAFDTDKGWYTAVVPQVTLSAKLRHMSTPYVTFTRTDFISQRMYVRFPQNLRLLNSWMYQAAASGDGFGWQTRGAVSCTPPPKRDPNAKALHGISMKADPKDTDGLNEAPGSASTIIDAKAAPPLFDEKACSRPFKEATVKSEFSPEWPLDVRISAQTASIVTVAINADGSLADAWIDGPSGYQVFDDAAIYAAKRSTFAGATAYCQSVPATYHFDVTWSPN